MVAKLSTLLASHAAKTTGSSTLVPRAMVLHEPLSIDLGEVTDKGSVNQRGVLANRAALVDDLFTASPSARVIVLARTG